MRSRWFVDVSRKELRACASVLSSQDEIDEMAIPSYCHKNPLARSLFWSRLSEALDMLAPRRDETYLDFGSGSGVLLPSLAANSENTFAADMLPEPSRQMVRRRKLDNVTVLDTPLPSPADLGNRRLDGITCLDVLEHVTDLPATIRALRELLDHQGRIVVCGPTESLMYRFGRRLAGFAGKAHYHHTDIFHISETFVQQGFRLVSSARLFRPPLPRLFLISRFELI